MLMHTSLKVSETKQQKSIVYLKKYINNVFIPGYIFNP